MFYIDRYRIRIGASKGKLTSYVWPGGYPVFYIHTHGPKGHKEQEVLCPDCANATDPRQLTGDGVNWEDPELFCSRCNNRIESAYAENVED
jgi:hypothetical protein